MRNDKQSLWASIIHDFVAKNHWERLLFFANSPKRQDELYHELLHVPVSVSPSSLILEGSKEAIQIYSDLSTNETCNVLSVISEYDNEILPFPDAYNAIAQSGVESILYNQDIHLAYYEGGEGDRYYLKRSESTLDAI